MYRTLLILKDQFHFHMNVYEFYYDKKYTYTGKFTADLWNQIFFSHNFFISIRFDNLKGGRTHCDALFILFELKLK